MSNTVKIDGEVKSIAIGRKEDKDGIHLVAKVLIEFIPTEKGIEELQDLLAMQELPVKISITSAQLDLPNVAGAKG